MAQYIKEELLNRMRYVKMAVDNWRKNVYHKPKKWAEEQQKYFEREAALIEKELKKLDKICKVENNIK